MPKDKFPSTLASFAVVVSFWMATAQPGYTQQITAKLLSTFPNPAPATGDWFGSAVAAVGTNGVLVGAYGNDTVANNSGIAYLFSTSGSLITTFNNPVPADSDFFGFPVVAVGPNRVLIGATSVDVAGVANAAGAAYLFGTNGVLITTINNPSPRDGDYFGSSAAALGNDRVLIGAPSVNFIGPGRAYLFGTNGAVLTVFTNPVPVLGDGFGGSLATVGTDQVLVGAPSKYGSAGTAYLFDTNGTLITTFVNPALSAYDYFGSSVAALGSDRVVIGTPGENTGALGTGAVYLFNTNGALLKTFTKPGPLAGYHFGVPIAAVGTDRILIGSPYDDLGATNAGAAYLFDTNGTLLTTFTNPTPAVSDLFASSIAVSGTNTVIIGAQQDDTGATDAGIAYLYHLIPKPPLRIVHNSGRVIISWPASAADFQLESAQALTGGNNWSAVTNVPVFNLNTLSVTNDASSAAKFYRLRKP